MADKELQGKVVLVTGAGSGLGEATAHAFAHEGCTVACIDIDREAAERVSRDLEAMDVPSMAFACDVSNDESVFRTVNAVAGQAGHVDIVVNNAAIDHTVSIEDMTVAQWDQVIGVNLRGPFLFAKAVLPLMREQHGGHIINIASTAATRAWANASAYHASKWGVVGFSRALGVEGREHGIRVTTVIPGGMKTHFFDRFTSQGIPMPEEKNLQDPANVAQLIVFATKVPADSSLQEVIFTPVTETSWP